MNTKFHAILFLFFYVISFPFLQAQCDRAADSLALVAF